MRFPRRGQFPLQWCWLRSWPTSSGGRRVCRGWGGELRARWLGPAPSRPSSARSSFASPCCAPASPSRSAARPCRRRGAARRTPTPRTTSSTADLADSPGNAALRELGPRRRRSWHRATGTPAAAPAALTDQPPLAGAGELRVRAVLDPAPVVDLQHHRPVHAGLFLHRREPQRHARRERAGMERLREPGPGRPRSPGRTPPGSASC